ncbi:hypothetical protein D3C85_1735020 [compost metagenome]
MLTVFDDQVGLDLEVTAAVARGRAQAALVELAGHRLADALFGEVALDPRIVRAVLQPRLLPDPAAVGGKVTAGIEVLGNVAALAGAEQQH